MSTSGEHRSQDPEDGIHVVHRYVFANATDRANFANELSGDPRNAVAPTAADVGAVARQTSDATWWVLTNHAPVTWKDITGAGGGGGGYATVQEEGSPLTQRTTLNFIGAALTAADNAGQSRTDVTLSQSPASASVVGTGRALTAGSGLTGGGDLSADRTFNVGAHADGSIVVNADDVQVGVLATDGQHGTRGGGTLHAAATGGANGFMSSSDKTKIDAFAAAAEYIRRDGSVPFTGAQSFGGFGATNMRAASRTVQALGNVTGTVNLDFTQGTVITATLTGNITIGTVTAPTGPASSFMLILTQSAGGNTITLPTGWRTTNGTQPTLGSQAGDVNIISGIYDGTRYIVDTSSVKRAL